MPPATSIAAIPLSGGLPTSAPPSLTPLEASLVSRIGTHWRNSHDPAKTRVLAELHAMNPRQILTILYRLEKRGYVCRRTPRGGWLPVRRAHQTAAGKPKRDRISPNSGANRSVNADRQSGAEGEDHDRTRCITMDCIRHQAADRRGTRAGVAAGRPDRAGRVAGSQSADQPALPCAIEDARIRLRALRADIRGAV